MTEIFNLRTLCRCCHSDGTFRSLQLPYTHDNRIEVYAEMLKETLDVMINPPPFEASYAICDICVNKLREAVYFKQQVLECEQKFEEYCKNEQALVIKEEVEFESSINGDSNTEDQSNEVCGYDDTNFEETEDQKSTVKSEKIKTDEEDNTDEICNLDIKDEEVKIASPKTVQETVPIEYVKTDRAKELVSARTSKKGNGKARGKRKILYEVDFELESHEKTEDGDIFTCRTCGKKYKVLKLLRNHVLKQHKEAYKCYICSLQCDGRMHYLSHIKTHKTEFFNCQFCGKSFQNKNSLLQHINAHTKTEKFQCDICQKFFAYKQTLRKHLLWHYGANKTCMCDICGHSFNDKTNLNIHIRVVHEKLRPFKCNLCSKTFTANKHLKLHMFYHSGEKPFKCTVCIDEFVSPWKLKDHQIKYHPNSSAAAQSKKLYTCKICKLELESRGRFMAHMRKHIGQREYKCHLCTKDFSCKYSLNRHINEHSGIKAYSCDICGKKYTGQSQVYRHKKRLHDPESPFYSDRIAERVKCDLCNKSFENLQKHMVSHKSRPHTCEICLKSYPERNTLNRHIKIVHHGIKLHPCTLCEKKYTKLSGLQKHTKKIHKLELKREVE